MLKQLAAWIFRIAYRQSLWDFTEAVKREWLEKGHARGKQAPRAGLPFALILTTGDETSQPASVLGARGSGYRWWGCVDPENGHEVCFGTIEQVGLHKALDAYLEMLGSKQTAWLQGIPGKVTRGTRDEAEG